MVDILLRKAGSGAAECGAGENRSATGRDQRAKTVSTEGSARPVMTSSYVFVTSNLYVRGRSDVKHPLHSDNETFYKADGGPPASQQKGPPLPERPFHCSACRPDQARTPERAEVAFIRAVYGVRQ